MKKSIFKSALLATLFAVGMASVFTGCKDDDEPIIPVEKVTLNKFQIPLAVGESESLVATVTPNNAVDKSVVWTTSDATVATVADGVVTAVAASQTPVIITATSVADKTKYATCEVTVSIPVTSVTVEPTTLSLFQNETATLTATIAPDNASNQAVIWSSSDENVATVSEAGVVTAMKASDTPVVITATSVTDGTKTDICTVKVAIPFINWLVGTWTWTDYDYSDGTTTDDDTYPVEITKTDANEIDIYNVWAGSKTIKATVDAEKRQVVIDADQTIYVHPSSSYGNITMDYFDGATMKDKPIIAQYTENGLEIAGWTAYTWSGGGYFGRYKSTAVKKAE